MDDVVLLLQVIGKVCPELPIMVKGWVFSTLLVVFLVFAAPCEAFYLPGSYMHTYRQSEEIGGKGELPHFHRDRTALQLLQPPILSS